MLSKPVFCKIPRVMNNSTLALMEQGCGSIPDERVDELLKLIPADKNNWTDHLDIAAFERAKKVHEQLSSLLDASGGRGVELADAVDAAAYHMDMLEFAAKASFLGDYLRNQLRKFLHHAAHQEPPPEEVSVIDLDHQSQWAFLAVDEDSQYADRLRILDRSHVCRVDHREMVVEELTADYSVDRNEIERQLGEHFRRLSLNELLYKAQEYLGFTDLLECAAEIEEEE